jgi:hypothetical protein
MKTYLKVVFDSSDFNTEFTIEDISAFPVHGEFFSANWEDFISDPAILKALKEYEENASFIAAVLNKKYSKDRVEILVFLMSEEGFKRFSKHE